jgi:hypothetical protein
LRFSPLLALLALIGMLAVSYWHDAMPHVHDVDGIVNIDPAQHVHAPSGSPDSDDMMHIVTHVVLQTVTVPAAPMLAYMVVPMLTMWSLAPPETGRTSSPLSILRPPQG